MNMANSNNTNNNMLSAQQQDFNKKMFENFPFMNPQNNPLANFDMNILQKQNFLFPLMRNPNDNINWMNQSQNQNQNQIQKPSQVQMKNLARGERDDGDKK
jgi:hypothetical protein